MENSDSKASFPFRDAAGMKVTEGGSVIRPMNRPGQLTLAHKLKAFDPQRHGGEVMVRGRVGAEVF